MADHNAEQAEWVLVAEDGTSIVTDEQTARRAINEPDRWTINGSPVHSALTRPDGASLYEQVEASTSPASTSEED